MSFYLKKTNIKYPVLRIKQGDVLRKIFSSNHVSRSIMKGQMNWQKNEKEVVRNESRTRQFKGKDVR